MILPRIGTAGWSIPSRYADVVPVGGSHLHRYAACLGAVEINTSFYRPHRRVAYERWASSVPEDFQFAVKMPKTVSHDRGLAGCEALVARFLEEAGGLGAKLGVILVQLPPSLEFDGAVADRFFADLRQRTSAQVVCEPRHPGWFTMAVDGLFEAHGVVRVAADPALVVGAGEPGGWSGLVYRRLHGAPRIYVSPYERATLDRLAAALTAAAKADVRSWCVFDNTAAGHALGDALALTARLPLAFGLGSVD